MQNTTFFLNHKLSQVKLLQTLAWKNDPQRLQSSWQNFPQSDSKYHFTVDCRVSQGTISSPLSLHQKRSGKKHHCADFPVNAFTGLLLLGTREFLTPYWKYLLVFPGGAFVIHVDASPFRFVRAQAHTKRFESRADVKRVVWSGCLENVVLGLARFNRMLKGWSTIARKNLQWRKDEIEGLENRRCDQSVCLRSE